VLARRCERAKCCERAPLFDDFSVAIVVPYRSRFVALLLDLPTNAQRLAPAPAPTSRDFRSTEHRDFSKLNARNTKYLAVSIALIVGFVEFLPRAEAVVPPPDGAYPNFTTAEGQNALHSLTSGAANTALGAYSLFSATTASFNTAVGAGALDLNTGDSNPVVSVAALLPNTGTQNTAVGVDALLSNTTGLGNTAIGVAALLSNTTGNVNTATGINALENNVDGIENTATGFAALLGNTTGIRTPPVAFRLS
jgi:hypothetical protein